MALPESIGVRYTEEDAGYVTVRPIVRQTFRLDQLLDMILSVTGKDVSRIRQILKSGTIVYHFYRYWWAGFDADDAELSAVLKQFPDADPSRTFSGSRCVTVVFESAGVNARPLLELDRAAASHRRMFRAKSFWESLVEITGDAGPSYQGYSYSHRADVYRLELNQERAVRIAQAVNRLAPRTLRTALRILPGAAQIVFICPRPADARPTVGSPGTELEFAL